MDVVILHERLDGGVLNDNQLAPVGGACRPRALDQLDQTFSNLLAAAFRKRPHDNATLARRRQASDQMRVQLAEYEVR